MPTRTAPRPMKESARSAPLRSAMSDRNTLPTTRPRPSSEARRSHGLRHLSAAPSPAAAKGQPGGRVDVPFRFAGQALVQVISLEEMADFERHPEKGKAGGENQRRLPENARSQSTKADQSVERRRYCIGEQQRVEEKPALDRRTKKGRRRIEEDRLPTDRKHGRGREQDDAAPAQDGAVAPLAEVEQPAGHHKPGYRLDCVEIEIVECETQLAITQRMPQLEGHQQHRKEYAAGLEHLYHQVVGAAAELPGGEDERRRRYAVAVKQPV